MTCVIWLLDMWAISLRPSEKSLAQPDKSLVKLSI